MSAGGVVDATTGTGGGELLEFSEASGPMEASAALGLEWVFGFSKNVIGGLHNLTDSSRDAIFYTSGHTGIVYDYAQRRQFLLQGHCNSISAVAVSEDKRWIITADRGADSLVVVWDAYSFVPVKTLFTPHPNGVVAIDVSADSQYVVTLSHGVPGETVQEVAVWEWTADRDTPICVCAIPTPDLQTSVRFNKLDARQIVTNGQDRVVFWSWEDGKMKFYAPPVSQKDLRQPVGAFTVSCFLPVPGRAVTGTSDGDMVLWDGTPYGAVPGDVEDSVAEGADAPGSAARQEWGALKVLHVVPSKLALEVIITVGGNVVSGSADGVVRVFDSTLKIVSWYEDIVGGPISSVSFAAAGGSVGVKKSLADPTGASLLSLPDFVVGTKQALVIGMQASMFEELTPEQRRGTLLVQGMDDDVHGVAVHPYMPQLTLTCDSGALHVWDYEQKQLLMVRLLDATASRPHAVMYDVQGRFVAVGSTAGHVHILNPQSLMDTQPTLTHSRSAITDIRFSADGVFMALADADRYVYIYRYMPTTVSKSLTEHGGTKTVKQWQLEEGVEEEKAVLERWTYLGRARSHAKPITGLEFSMTTDGIPVLTSVGEDNRLVLYNLMESSINNGVVIIGERTRVEQSATPTACAWYPQAVVLDENGTSAEQMIVVANDEFKLKIWASDSRACRYTRLGPTFGGPINRLIHVGLPTSDISGAAAPTTDFFVYSTADRVIGVVALPLDGNPARSMGVIAHPSTVASVAASRDGKYVLTAGGSDSSVCLWRIDSAVVQRMAAVETGLSPYLAMLEGGADGDFYKEMQDLFIYCQIRSQGEDSMSPRACGDSIPVSELPNFMRAVGYYPTELEVDQLVSEVQYSNFASTGVTKNTVTLAEAVRLYVNHRPVLGVGKAAISSAVQLLAQAVGREGIESNSIAWRDLVAVLSSTGELFNGSELDECLRALTGEPLDETALVGHENMSGKEITQDLLGFEEY